MSRDGVAILRMGGVMGSWNVDLTLGFANYHPDFANCVFVVTILLTDSQSLQETPPCQ